MPALVTLTTDFGLREPSVAEIKGVLLGNSPGVQIIDLGHQIPQGNIMEAAFFILRSIPHFPEGTIHLVNIAPGPDPIIISMLGQYIVCPDNGVVTMLSNHYNINAAHNIPIPDELKTRPGQIYFGRDVFAPAIAQLAGGAALAEIGEPRENVKLLDTTRPDRARDDLVYGEIIYINRFGNLVTNIHVSDLADCHVKEIRAGDFTLGGLKQSYADVPPKMPLALIGSAGYLEVAYNNDRADVRLDLSLGIRVTVVVEPNAN